VDAGSVRALSWTLNAKQGNIRTVDEIGGNSTLTYVVNKATIRVGHYTDRMKFYTDRLREVRPPAEAGIKRYNILCFGALSLNERGHARPSITADVHVFRPHGSGKELAHQHARDTHVHGLARRQQRGNHWGWR